MRLHVLGGPLVDRGHGTVRLRAAAVVLEENGEYVDTRALSPAQTWVRYGGPDAAPVTTDGPHPETSDLVAGFWMIDFDSHERAG